MTLLLQVSISFPVPSPEVGLLTLAKDSFLLVGRSTLPSGEKNVKHWELDYL